MAHYAEISMLLDLFGHLTYNSKSKVNYRNIWVCISKSFGKCSVQIINPSNANNEN